jgi:RNA ligase-like protein
MNQYHKIQTVFLRNPDDNFKSLLVGEFAKPEFDYLQNCDWEWEEKVDGTNIRVIIQPPQTRNISNEILFRGKTDGADIPKFLLYDLKDLFFGLDSDLFDAFPEGACFYGEGVGDGIQKGGRNYIPNCTGFCLYDIRVGHWWLKRDAVRSIGRTFGLLTAPVVGVGNLWDMVERVQGGMHSQWGEFEAEGIVARPLVELLDRSGQRVITKLKTRDFT